MMHEEPAIHITVRNYRSADESVIDWLHRNGHLHGDTEDDLTAVLRSMDEASQTGSHFVLVVEVDGRVIGATAIAKQREPIAHLRWLCIAPDWQAEPVVARRLVETAIAHAREQGWLKLVVHTCFPASRVADFFHHQGFAFSRARSVGGTQVLEFYLDLYFSSLPQAQRLPAAWRPSERRETYADSDCAPIHD